jgi:hypothetical protein
VSIEKKATIGEKEKMEELGLKKREATDDG